MKFEITHKETWTWIEEVEAESEKQVKEMIDNEEIYFSMDDDPDFEQETEINEATNAKE